MNAWKQFKAAKKAAAEQKRLDGLKSKTRKPEDIGREYSLLCSEAGDKQYRRQVLDTELEGINKRLHLLNQEYDQSIKVHGEPTAPVPKAQLTQSETKEPAIASPEAPEVFPEVPNENQSVPELSQ